VVISTSETYVVILITPLFCCPSETLVWKAPEGQQTRNEKQRRKYIPKIWFVKVRINALRWGFIGPRQTGLYPVCEQDELLFWGNVFLNVAFFKPTRIWVRNGIFKVPAKLDAGIEIPARIC